MCLGSGDRCLQRSVAAVAGALVLTLSPAEAAAAPGALAERTRRLLAQLEADAEARAVAEPAARRARQALERAAAAPPEQAVVLEETALQHAELARDLVRASEAERLALELEQQAAALATEIARLRAIVEQALARLGRARQELKAVEASRGAAREGR